jgi:hypothetical protein
MSKIRLIELPDRLVGKDADTVDGYHAGDFPYLNLGTATGAIAGEVRVGTVMSIADGNRASYPASGKWLQIWWTGRNYAIEAYDRTNSVYLPFTIYSSTTKITGQFGCNNATPQAAYASGGPVTDEADATYSANEVTMLNNLKALVNNIRTALVNNGIMS